MSAIHTGTLLGAIFLVVACGGALPGGPSDENNTDAAPPGPIISKSTVPDAGNDAGAPEPSIQEVEIRSGPRSQPDEIVKDSEDMKAHFEELPELDEPPPFLTARTLIRALPRGDRKYHSREIKEALGEDGGGIDLHGAFLDADKSLFLLRYQYDAITNVYVLLDSQGNFRGSLPFEERTGAMLKDVTGDETKELIVTVIEGNSLSVYPESWRIYEARKAGLRKIGRVARGYSEGSKEERYFFLNTITFPKKGLMRVETVYHSYSNFEDLEPPRGYPRGTGALSEYEIGKRGKFELVNHKPGVDENGEMFVDNVFALTIHVATTKPEDASKRIGQKIETANDHYSQVGMAFDGEDTRELPESFAVIENIPERHKLKKYLVKKTINVFVVDEILDPHPSKATKKAAKWQGRKPSGRLTGAHIEVKNRIPDTYIIISRRSPKVTLTHELGHFFGLPHHRDPANIMSYGRDRAEFDRRQLKVIKSQAKKIVRKRHVKLADQ